MVKAGIPPSISKETVLGVLRKTDQPKMDSFSEERNLDQYWPEIETKKFPQKVYCKHAAQLWNMKSSESLW